MFTFIVLVLTVPPAAFMVFYFEDHFWLIPVFFLVNVLLSWILIQNLVLKSFLFSYGQSFITNRELQSLNS